MGDYQAYFRGKKITVMGLGLLGRGLGDIEFLADCGAELIVTDLKTEDELASSLASLKRFPDITYRLGSHQLEDFRHRDLIIKAAGVPLDSPFIAEARACGIPVEMSTALFARLSGATLVGVTGTRGKSTTTHLLYHILNTWKAEVSPLERVWLGGNVRGLSTLALLREVQPAELAVLELDSWQLQGFGEARLSPHIAVFTNLFPDHLNYYHGDLERYFSDKANIFRFQTERDFTIAGPNIAARIETKGQKIVPKDLPGDWSLLLPGAHNRQNAALAVAAAEALQVPPEIIQRATENFAGVPGRLELVAEYRSVKIYNDTTATTPEATIAALQALGSEKKNIVLVMGGADKNLNMNQLLELIPSVCKAVILLPGTGTENLDLPALSCPVTKVSSLAEAFSAAVAKAQPGDVFLFSPAFASFGPPPGGFKNEFDRGDQFMDLVRRLA